MKKANLDEFLAFYNEHGEHPVTEIELNPGDRDNGSPFIVVHSGPYALIINPQPFNDHLSVDCFPFKDGERVTASAFGMPHGRRVELHDTGTTSHGFPSAPLIAVLIGKQAEV